jgi:hypothetical protein
MKNPLLDAVRAMKAKRVAIVVGDADEMGLPDMQETLGAEAEAGAQRACCGEQGGAARRAFHGAGAGAAGAGAASPSAAAALFPGSPRCCQAAHHCQRNATNITVHGFRSSFRDWVAEETNHPSDVAEMALAHTVENKVIGAYKRGNLLDKRRRLANDWEDYCIGYLSCDNVISLKV